MKRLLTIAIGVCLLLFVLHWLLSPSPSDSGSDSSSSHSSNLAGTKPTTPSVQDWHVLLATRILDYGQIAAKYGWKLTITNESSQTSGFKGELQFFDVDGFLVDRYPLYDSSQSDTEYTMRNGYPGENQFRLVVPANSEAVFTGTANVELGLASRVTTVKANIHKETHDEQPRE